MRIGTEIATCLLALLYASVGQAATPPDIAYEVRFAGVEDTALKKHLREASGLARTQEDFSLPFLEEEDTGAALTLRALHAKAKEELPALLGVLHAEGYFDATLNLVLDAKKHPAIVSYRVKPGTRYLIESEDVVLAGSDSVTPVLPGMDALPALLGKPAQSDALRKKAEAVRKRVAVTNCVLSVEVKPAIRLDPGHYSVHATYELITGAAANFGPISIIGNGSVKREAVERYIPWKQGACFHASQLQEAQNSLLKSGLFATAEITHADTPDANGEVPVTITLQERFHRTVKAGISYMTDEGPGTRAAWEHRNFFGNGENVTAQGVLSALEYSAEAGYAEPYFLRPDQSLKLGARIAHESPDAYTSDHTSVSAHIERELGLHWRAGVGAAYRLSNVEDYTSGTETFGLISLPAYASYDSRNDLLNPTHGIQARLDTAPYFDTLGSGSGFIKSLGTASTYFAFPGTYEPVIAVRGALGSIAGAAHDNIPADVRFYAGGGSSVRGYGYQELSPERNGELIGGKSLLEVSTELRFKATDMFGGALFLDGGNAYASEYPDLEENLRWGAGAGVRYFSDFGPLRLDVAVPLNKQDSDRAFQLYVSLGQAF